MSVKKFLLANLVVLIAWILAAVSMFFIPPDAGYASYFDFKTLVCLFAFMLVIAAYKGLGVFGFLSGLMIRKLKNTRLLGTYLVMMTYVLSILIANDMALLTLLPLTLLVFKQCRKEKYIARTVILQNIAANIGGMIMPFGNPQSLYIFNYYGMELREFLRIMAPPFVTALVLLLALCMTFKKEPVQLFVQPGKPPSAKKTVLYALCFMLAAVSVFDVVNFWIAGGAVLVIVLATDFKSLRQADYGLLLTFAAFFIFANNMARMESVREFVTALADKDTLLTSALSCQIFSNVPTALFLSKFTADYPSLLLGVNIGGTGTLVASLASLISFRIYTKEYPGQSASYIGKFSLLNFLFLGVLLGQVYLFRLLF